MNLRLLQALLAGAQILTAGTALADVIGLRWAALTAYNGSASKPAA